MKMITYEWIRSRRRTVAVQIKEGGHVVVRTPYCFSRAQVEQFLEERREWILKNQKALREAQKQKAVITEEMRQEGMKKAREIIPERVEYYARLMGVSYGRIAIREQKTRWGSCSGKGNLNFNWKLTLMPIELLDYVIVHELAHRMEMNHSRDFWRIVEQILPDYQERRRELKEWADRI